MSTNEKVVVYQNEAGEWRWRWVRSSDIIANSGQGYAEKRGAIQNLEYISNSTYAAEYTVRAAKRRSHYQQGHLIGREPASVFVEVIGKPGVQA